MRIIIETKNGKQLQVNKVDTDNVEKFCDWYKNVCQFPADYDNVISVGGTNNTMWICYREISYFLVED